MGVFHVEGWEPRSADCKRGRRKGATSKKVKIVKKCQKVFRHFSRIFAQGERTPRIVKKRQEVFRHFLTIFARHHFSGPFWGAVTKSSICPSKPRGTKPCGRDIPGFCWDIPAMPEKFENKKVCVQFLAPNEVRRSRLRSVVYAFGPRIVG